MLRALVGFDHCVKNQVNAWFPVSGYKISQLPIPSSKGVLVDQFGGLSSPLTAAMEGECRWILDLSEFTSAQAERVIVAMTVRHRVGGSTGVLYSIASLADASDRVDVVTFEDLPSTDENRTTYVEIEINFLTGKALVYLDNVAAKTIALSSTLIAALRLGRLVVVGTTAPAGSVGVCATQDIYLVDNMGVDGLSARFGKRLVAPLVLKSATATEWTPPSGKTPLETLKTLAAPSATDVVKSPKALSIPPLTVGLSSESIPLHAGIPAISIRFSGKVSNAGNRLTSYVVQRSITGVRKSYAMDTSMKYGIQGGVIVDSLDGGAWDTNRIDDTTFTLEGWA